VNTIRITEKTDCVRKRITFTRCVDELGSVARQADRDCLENEIGGFRSEGFMNVRGGYIG